MLFVFRYLRQRKEGLLTLLYLWGMNAHFLHAQITVEEVLKKWPQTYTAFLNRNTGCIGCLLQRFCSIQDVADTYEFALQDLISELEQCVMKNNQPKGA